MVVSSQYIQDPEPGKHLLTFMGDTITFTLSLPEQMDGRAWLRTNIGQAAIIREEIINELAISKPPLCGDWFDIPMVRKEDLLYTITLPLCETGHFEAKCLFLKEGEDDPVWPEGPNAVINVEPADTCCANTIYNAFVRQFGPNKAGQGILDAEKENWVKVLDENGYSVIPPSGKFRDLINELDFIIYELGCRIIHLLPVHPTPTTYGRMGRFGSPYAALSFRSVDPALAEFDSSATPVEQFCELVDKIHARGAKLFIDVAINHSGWAATLHGSHPEWLVRNEEGKIEAPGAWGVVWADLTRLDYSHKGLWVHMANVFLTWCDRGVDGFRCDAGYMIPIPAWKYIVACVRRQFPDTVFFLEGLGGKISVSKKILDEAGFNWVYSELFQNYDQKQIVNYLPDAFRIFEGDGVLVHFAETHDNPRLAVKSENYARMRTALCALTSINGAFGFANGVEWLATEKIDVHQSRSLNWGAENNQVAHIRRLNTILKFHPAFQNQVELRLIQTNDNNSIAMLRHHHPSGKKVLIAVNLDDNAINRVSWETCQMPSGHGIFTDLVTGRAVQINQINTQSFLDLEAGQVFCLTTDEEELSMITRYEGGKDLPIRLVQQRLRVRALEIFKIYNGICDLGEFDTEKAISELVREPEVFCRAMNTTSEESRVIRWQWPRDIRRKVMVPPDHFLMIQCPFPFRARLLKNRYHTIVLDESFYQPDNNHFILFMPLKPETDHKEYTLKLTVFNSDSIIHEESAVMYLANEKDIRVKSRYNRQDVVDNMIFLASNHRGGMMRAAVSWGKLQSRYDALLAGNLNRQYPEDRWIMLARCRLWLVFQGFSHEVDFSSFDTFYRDMDGHGCWHYNIPTGQGGHISFFIMTKMITGENCIQLDFYRQRSEEFEGRLPDHEAIQLIIRPDIEDRSFHDTTKAFMGPESIWPGSVKALDKGFTFRRSEDRIMMMEISSGEFSTAPEWQYMVFHPFEASRGLDPDSDLFSPGYFSAFLQGDKTISLVAKIICSENEHTALNFKNYNKHGFCVDPVDSEQIPVHVMKIAMQDFIVDRDGLKSVIAGYPWFLDWGRDAIIFSRGMIAAGQVDEAKAVLKLFGQFEENGTLPNMIRGNDIGNRDTSDAQLWFFTACNDVLAAEQKETFLEEACGRRTVREILVSIGNAMINGTSNGIHMDHESCLIFSPSHFTWMDTNHPAGSPREGYPIEIQALWFGALSLLSRIDATNKSNPWQAMAQNVQASIIKFFWQEEYGFLSDCLHAESGISAENAEPDDALRPNQLFVIALGAVSEKSYCRRILDACQELLVPGAIRSLADRPVKRPLPVVRNGELLNDPENPYQGKYEGDEDRSRKPAYHNGTAWTWIFPVFCEAWALAYGENAKVTALSFLCSGTGLMEKGCIGHMPEIVDGDYPHTPRGCDAQAWGCSEFVRVWEKILKL
ncbi:MAG: glycogen debranching enzyme N-terminal domain-containing protein [Desulfobacterales bacterium]|nr:glycogen debranching enzyme N-terminal domain-containing protein [Desulfobacterales bacterium]